MEILWNHQVISSFADPLNPRMPKRFVERSRTDIRFWREHGSAARRYKLACVGFVDHIDDGTRIYLGERDGLVNLCCAEIERSHREHVTQAFLKMKKFDIAALQRAAAG